MGLDMYLTKKIWVGANYSHSKVTGKIELEANGKPIPVDLKKVKEISEDAGYWRKANAIHKWFVDNVQDGEDECKSHYVEYEQLKTLRDLCQKVLDTKDASLLPPQSGFFFGSTDIDEGYYQDLKDTIAIVDALDPDAEYEYRSSW